MSNFKSIPVGKFFQDREYYEFNSKHCYLKIDRNHFIDLREEKKIDARKKYNKEDLEGDWCYRFSEVKVNITINRGY